MAQEREKEYCINCRKETEYFLQKKNIIKTIKNKEYRFNVTIAQCSECHEEMNIQGLIDKNIQEIDEQYRAYEGIVSISDIYKLMHIYKLGKAPLSLALGFGEITITRYLSGQIPSKEYSDIIRLALSSPTYMKKLLIQNKDKIAESSFNKAMNVAIQMENQFSVSDKMLQVIAYVFEELEEVTPLMLQKILYFIQGLSYAINNKPMFYEECEAWVHGPVYREVYDMFKDFKYNPIDDVRFVIFEGITDELTIEDKKIIDLVSNTFGMYSGKMLERITHKEDPWKTARQGYSDHISSHEILSKQMIKDYYRTVSKKYDLSCEEGINLYIRDMLKHS
ncbi:MAG: DUF4065 domain-containing protein [Erysipelotrichaceae bacterium]|nr:DUF4065 domain-containing protein [Erysipelotrichaceae bacterium]